MAEKYYFDTCIWVDYLENRTDRFRPLGDWALMLINKIIKNNWKIVYSDLTVKELSRMYGSCQIKDMFELIPSTLLIKSETLKSQIHYANRLSLNAGIPRDDALHAIIAMQNNAVLVTRDSHFNELQISLEIRKPEELI